MKVKTRITLHFLLQFIVSFVVILLSLIFLVLLLMNIIIEDELNKNTKTGIVQNLPFNTLTEDGEFIIPENWEKILKENEMWLQVIDEDGKVFYSYNTPSELQNLYTMNDLLLIKESNQLGEYTVDTFLDTWDPGPYYYLFGYIDHNQQLVNDWYETYSADGFINEDVKLSLAKEVEEHQGMLEIYHNGTLIEKIGNDLPAPDQPLNVLSSIEEPGNSETNAYVINNESENISWIFHQANNNYMKQSFSAIPQNEMQLFLLITGSILIILIVMSVLYGYYYGKPLLLLTDWLKLVEEKQYEDVLEGKEHKKIYKKNGKVKFRYYIYKSVFNSFLNMSKKLAEADKEREQLEKTREEWMAGISHDMRTPLSSIQGYGYMLESDQYDYTKEELQQIGKVIRDQSDYMVDLVNDFSLIFRLKNSAITIHKEPIDMNEFLQTAIDKYRHDFTLKNNVVTFEPAPEPYKAMIDPKWFIRVIDNLLSNAIKHNPPQTNIHVKVEYEADKTKVIITDDGKGMDKSFADHLFERYYRGTTTSERTEGEGLGMSIAYGIVELHGGKIEVESELDVGTRISIIIPRNDET